MAALLSAHAGFLFWSGIALAVVGAIWMLFAAYQCDTTLARWMIFLPPIAIYFIFRYPRECMRPFLLCVIALILITTGAAFATVTAVHALNTTVPDLNSK